MWPSDWGQCQGHLCLPFSGRKLSHLMSPLHLESWAEMLCGSDDNYDAGVGRGPLVNHVQQHQELCAHDAQVHTHHWQGMWFSTKKCSGSRSKTKTAPGEDQYVLFKSCWSRDHRCCEKLIFHMNCEHHRSRYVLVFSLKLLYKPCKNITPHNPISRQTLFGHNLSWCV